MGVKTQITLQKVEELFPEFSFKYLIESSSGVQDTTYISDLYIIKKYERKIDKKIAQEIRTLQELRKIGLNVSLFLAESKGWYLYEKLRGESPQSIKFFHIQALARTLSKLHRYTKYDKNRDNFLAQYQIKEYLQGSKKKFYFYYKKMQALENYTMPNDGFIHGDLFRDNTLFENEKIALLDFIDGGNGSFVFDMAVSLLSFNPHKKRSFLRLFLNTYNQNALKKVSLQELEKNIAIAAKLYGLLRIIDSKNIIRAQELAKFW